MSSKKSFCKKKRTKIENRKFKGTKKWRKFLEGLKLKIIIFRGTNNFFFVGKGQTTYLTLVQLKTFRFT